MNRAMEDGNGILPLIFGCTGTSLSPEEARFFRAVNPLGFILFARNCQAPRQVRSLVDSLRQIRNDAPIFIDQEGGRVARLRPPQWRAAPPAEVFARLALTEPASARRAAYLNARLIAAELRDLGVTVNCAPVLDIPVPGSHGIIGDRALGTDPDMVADLGGVVCEGFVAGGVQPVIKHIPGHGRPRTDSHVGLPIVDTPARDLKRIDFFPFRRLVNVPWAMTAHVVYRKFDSSPATLSRTVIEDQIRGEIGFKGLLISDDISMGALSGPIGTRATAALAAGCDVVLHCNGKMAEMREIADAMAATEGSMPQPIPTIGQETAMPFNRELVKAELDTLLEPVKAGV